SSSFGKYLLPVHIGSEEALRQYRYRSEQYYDIQRVHPSPLVLFSGQIAVLGKMERETKTPSATVCDEGDDDSSVVPKESESPEIDLYSIPTADDTADDDDQHELDIHSLVQEHSLPHPAARELSPSCLRFLFVPKWDYQLQNSMPRNLASLKTVPLPHPLSEIEVSYCEVCQVSWLCSDPLFEEPGKHPDHKEPGRVEQSIVVVIGSHVRSKGFAVTALFGPGSRHNVVEVTPRNDPPGDPKTHVDPGLRAEALAATHALRRIRGDGRHGFMPWFRGRARHDGVVPRIVVATGSAALVRVMAAKVVQAPLYNKPRARVRDGEEAGPLLLDDGELDALCEERLLCLKEGIDVWWYLMEEKDALAPSKVASVAAYMAYEKDGSAGWLDLVASWY
ncbi:hypothetical protein F5X99DRAFT_431959, partial [Biscogniauxia marginata]